MAKKYDVIALGELLIDFTMNGQSRLGRYHRRLYPGILEGGDICLTKSKRQARQ